MARTVHLHLDDRDQRQRDEEEFSAWLEENECLDRPDFLADLPPDLPIVTDAEITEMFADDDSQT